MAEYRLTREEAFGEFPLAAALALLPASIERRGGTPPGPSAEVAAFIRRAAEVKRWLDTPGNTI